MKYKYGLQSTIRYKAIYFFIFRICNLLTLHSALGIFFSEGVVDVWYNIALLSSPLHFSLLSSNYYTSI